MPTENERKENKDLQEKIEAKLSKKFGHAVPNIDRNRPIENNFELKLLDREKLQNPLKDFNMEEYNLWRQFNNRNERRQRSVDVKFIDEPGISDDEILSRLNYNKEALRRITLEQIERYPDLFKDFLPDASDS